MRAGQRRLNSCPESRSPLLQVWFALMLQLLTFLLFITARKLHGDWLLLLKLVLTLFVATMKAPFPLPLRTWSWLFSVLERRAVRARVQCGLSISLLLAE